MNTKMGRQKIEFKLQQAVQRGFKKESDVFYVIAQIRKYFELIYPNKVEGELKYPTFYLIADWILHSSLDRKLALKKIQEFEAFFKDHQSDQMFNFMKSGFTLFKDLKKDMEKIFATLQLNNFIFSNRKEWLKFVGLLIEILKDLPLLSKGKIKSFKFDEGFFVGDKRAVSFTIHFADCSSKSFTMDLELVDSD